MSFQGFSPKTAKFLRDLDKNNTREWFQKHRPEYEEHLMEPAREFILRQFPEEIHAGLGEGAEDPKSRLQELLR